MIKHSRTAKELLELLLLDSNSLFDKFQVISIITSVIFNEIPDLKNIFIKVW